MISCTWGFGSRVSSEPWTKVVVHSLQGLGFRVSNSGCGVWGSGLRGLGFRVLLLAGIHPKPVAKRVQGLGRISPV